MPTPKSTKSPAHCSECSHHINEMVRIHSLWAETKADLHSAQQQLQHAHQHTDDTQHYSSLVDNYHQQLLDLQHELHSKTQTIQHLQQQNTQLQQQCAAQQQQLGGGNDRYSQQVVINTELAIRVRELEGVIQQLRDEHSEQQQQQQQHHAVVIHPTHSKQLSVTNTNSALPDDIYQQLASITRDTYDLTQRLKDVATRNDRLEQQNEDYRQRNEQLQMRVDQMRRMVDDSDDDHQQRQRDKQRIAPYVDDLTPDSIQSFFTTLQHSNQSVSMTHVHDLHHLWSHYHQSTLQSLYKQYRADLQRLQKQLDLRLPYEVVTSKARVLGLQRQLHNQRHRDTKQKQKQKQYTLDQSLAAMQTQAKQPSKQHDVDDYLAAQYSDLLQELQQKVEAVIERTADAIWHQTNVLCDSVVDVVNKSGESTITAVTQQFDTHFSRLEQSIEQCHREVEQLCREVQQA